MRRSRMQIRLKTASNRAFSDLTGWAELPMFPASGRPIPPAKSLQNRPLTRWNYMKIVVVESPAKAKTINKYLGPDYEVLASFGHVRDLPAKDGSVDPEHGFPDALGGRRQVRRSG